MLTKLAAAVAISMVFAGVALADPVVVKDEAGRTYQLNADGTYDIVVKSADGRTFLLGADGTWGDADEDAAFPKRFLDFMDKAFAADKAPDVKAEDLPQYKQCMLTAFNGMKRDAKRLLLSDTDLQASFDKFEKAYPDQAKILNEADHACRQGLDKPN
jgi:hypothetical protein